MSLQVPYRSPPGPGPLHFPFIFTVDVELRRQERERVQKFRRKKKQNIKKGPAVLRTPHKDADPSCVDPIRAWLHLICHICCLSTGLWNGGVGCWHGWHGWHGWPSRSGNGVTIEGNERKREDERDWVVQKGTALCPKRRQSETVSLIYFLYFFEFRPASAIGALRTSNPTVSSTE
jgi:hypothetical protein